MSTNSPQVHRVERVDDLPGGVEVGQVVFVACLPPKLLVAVVEDEDTCRLHARQGGRGRVGVVRRRDERAQDSEEEAQRGEKRQMRFACVGHGQPS